MPLIHHDTTGTETDSVAPLSRKKLRALMPLNRNDLTSGALANPKNPLHISGRYRGWKAVSTVFQKQRERQSQRKLFAKRSLPDGTTFQLTPTAAEVEQMKPTLFERLGGLFGGFKKKFERMQAKGK
jgi:hypothetical protein